jgi:hypothetical protein
MTKFPNCPNDLNFFGQEGRGNFDGMTEFYGRILTGKHEIMKYMKKAGDFGLD